MITRQDYLKDGSNLHRKYFGQFVNEDVKKAVLYQFSLANLKKSFAEDEHFNTKLTPLRIWDLLGGFAFNSRGEMTLRPTTSSPIDYKLLKETGEGYSSSTAVCVYKEAARQIIEESK